MNKGTQSTPRLNVVNNRSVAYGELNQQDIPEHNMECSVVDTQPKNGTINGHHEHEEQIQCIEAVKNAKYATCRDKSFLFYKEMELLYGKTTLKGFHGFFNTTHDVTNVDAISVEDSGHHVAWIHLYLV
ncbi:hypothetical protein QJS10_CPA03g00727 [Acorus calamus]|uniref:Uncharacterized protein n=1 Tax=Acorus calamus TaxID=4465 RepID=A0AAV9F6A8_ACOCL|nr:hypothetical protein QJS10_CPA03g00727 [Acorus calamus]